MNCQGHNVKKVSFVKEQHENSFLQTLVRRKPQPCDSQTSLDTSQQVLAREASLTFRQHGLPGVRLQIPSMIPWPQHLYFLVIKTHLLQMSSFWL
jgi:hypothetical protein